MARPTRAGILRMMHGILARQGRTTTFEETAELREIGFRSLDFSELALRLEAESGRTLDFSGEGLRSIQSVRDVLDFLERACAADDQDC